ncbi:MAG: hypothetical protein AAB819_02960 [Patescibacteria group bacterium]
MKKLLVLAAYFAVMMYSCAAQAVVIGDPVSPTEPVEARIEFGLYTTPPTWEIRFSPATMVGSVEFFIKAPSKYDGQIGLRLYTGGTKSAVPVLYQHESITKPDGSVGIVCTMEFIVYDTQGNLLPNTFWGTRWEVFRSADPYRLNINLCWRIKYQ